MNGITGVLEYRRIGYSVQLVEKLADITFFRRFIAGTGIYCSPLIDVVGNNTVDAAALYQTAKGFC